MTKKELRKAVKAIKKLKKKVCKTKKSARAFLVKVGISTKKGKLRKPYR